MTQLAATFLYALAWGVMIRAGWRWARMMVAL
jgi:hypothetical protein